MARSTYLPVYFCLLSGTFFELLGSGYGIQFMGRAMSFDWHFRSQLIPPFRETLDLFDDFKSPNGRRVKLNFVAFGKKWEVDLVKNTLLYTERSSISLRDTKGRKLKSYNIESDCYYIGTAVGGDSEYGMVSLSTCGHKIHGMIITNVNDYIIYEKGWKWTRRKRSLHNRNLDIRVATTEEYESHVKTSHMVNKWKYNETKEELRSPFTSTNYTRLRRDVAEDIETPKFYRLEPPGGRNVYLELGLFVDKYYMDDFKNMVYDSTEELINHILLAYNNAQLWYIHPTLGFNIWLIVKDVILIDEDLPLSLDTTTLSNPASLCKWITRTFRENGTWDEIMILSSKPKIWHGRVGLAQRAGVCSYHGNDRCAGLSHVNFQMASLARLIAHEGMHPLGVGDDYEGRTARLCYSGVMRRGVWQDHDWSVCSVQAFERWAGAKISNCISRKQTPTIGGKKTPYIQVNIAWRSRAVQSTTYNSDEEWGAWKATDGPITGVPSNADARYGSCTHTLRQNKPWIRVDLPSRFAKKTIDTIIIYNRDDCCHERLKNFEVRVGGDPNFRRNSLCYHHKGGVSGGRNGAAVISCMKPLSGQYVSLQLQDLNTILTVCEIQVMAKVVQDSFSYRENECYDMDGFCPYWQSVGECTRRTQVSYMMENCPYSCGACRRPSRKPTKVKASSADEIPVTAKPGVKCQDSHDSCMHYAANGDCKVDLDTMRRCPKSCNICDILPEELNAKSMMTRTRVNNAKVESRPIEALKPTKNSSVSETQPSTLKTTKSSEVAKTTTKFITRRVPPTLSSKTATTAPAPFSKTTTTLSNRIGKPQTSIRPDSSQTTGSCHDSNPNCEGWTNIGYCETSTVVVSLCMKSCGRCDDITESPSHPPTSLSSSTSSTLASHTSSSTLYTVVEEATTPTTTSAATQSSSLAQPASSSKIPTAVTTVSASTATITNHNDKSTLTPTTRATPSIASTTGSTTTNIFTTTSTTTVSTVSGSKNTVGTSQVELKMAATSTSTCTDSLPSLCDIWASQNQCTMPSVKQLCKLTCDICGGTSTTDFAVTYSLVTEPVSKELSREATPVTTQNTEHQITSISNIKKFHPITKEQTVSTSCVDKRQSCEAWATNGHCSISSVRRQCPASCNSCQQDDMTASTSQSATTMAPSQLCTDNVSACSSWARRGLCTRSNVAAACKLSCGVCG